MAKLTEELLVAAGKLVAVAIIQGSDDTNL